MSAIDFYHTLSEDTSKSNEETVKIFRQHYKEKPVVFRERLARRVLQPVENVLNFLGDLQTLVLKTYSQVSAEIGVHLILRELLEIMKKYGATHCEKEIGRRGYDST